jgi:hypothetical protein
MRQPSAMSGNLPGWNGSRARSAILAARGAQGSAAATAFTDYVMGMWEFPTLKQIKS